MSVLRLLRCCCFTRANGPNWLVGDDGFDHLFLCQTGKAAAHLRLQNLFHLTAFALGKRFTDTDYRFKRCRVGRHRFFSDEHVGFLLILAAFGMAEDDVAHGKFLEHSGANLTGERAEIIFTHVLRAEPDVRTIYHGLRHRFKRGEWRADDDVHFPDVGQFHLEVIDQRHRLGNGLVHLPVTRNNQFTFFIHVFKIVSSSFSNIHSARTATAATLVAQRRHTR